MKAIFIFVSIQIFSYCSFAQLKINFIQDNFKEAQEKAIANNKILFVFIYDPECTHCNFVKANTFTDTALINFQNRNFINLMIDGTVDSGRQFCTSFKITAYPSFLYFDKNGKIVFSLSGEIKADEFISEAKYAMNPELNVPNLELQFNNDTGNAEKCLNFIAAIKKGVEKYKIGPTASRYISTQTNKQLISPINWKVMVVGVNDLRSKEFQFIVDHKAELATVSSVKRVDAKIVSVVNNTLKQDAERIDTTSFYIDKKYVQNLKTYTTDSLLFKYEVKINEYSKNWQQYLNIAKSGAVKYEWNDYKMLNEMSTNIFVHFSERANMQTALAFAKRANELNETYFSNYYIALIFHGLHDNENAKKFAFKSKKMADAKGIQDDTMRQLFKDLKIE